MSTTTQRLRRKWPAAAGLAAVALISAAGCGSVHAKPPATATPSSPSASASPAFQVQGGACSPDGSAGTAFDGTTLTCAYGSWTGTDTATPDPSPTETGPAQLSAGQAEVLGDSSDATIGVLIVGKPEVTSWPADTYGSRPANGYFVVVPVTATADQGYTDGWDVNPLDFHAVVNGQHYDQDNGNAFSALTDAQSGNDLLSTLSAGETVKGWLAFDLPSRHGTIVYAPNYDGQPVSEWSY